MRQEITRAHKGWALDTVILDNDVTRMMKEDVHSPPSEGKHIFFSHALLLALGHSLVHNAGFDGESECVCVCVCVKKELVIISTIMHCSAAYFGTIM